MLMSATDQQIERRAAHFQAIQWRRGDNTALLLLDESKSHGRAIHDHDHDRVAREHPV